MQIMQIWVGLDSHYIHLCLASYLSLFWQSSNPSLSYSAWVWQDTTLQLVSHSQNYPPWVLLHGLPYSYCLELGLECLLCWPTVWIWRCPSRPIRWKFCSKSSLVLGGILLILFAIYIYILLTPAQSFFCWSSCGRHFIFQVHAH